MKFPTKLPVSNHRSKSKHVKAFNKVSFLGRMNALANFHPNVISIHIHTGICLLLTEKVLVYFIIF